MLNTFYRVFISGLDFCLLIDHTKEDEEIYDEDEPEPSFIDVDYEDDDIV